MRKNGIGRSRLKSWRAGLFAIITFGSALAINLVTGVITLDKSNHLYLIVSWGVVIIALIIAVFGAISESRSSDLSIEEFEKIKQSYFERIIKRFQFLHFSAIGLEIENTKGRKLNRLPLPNIYIPSYASAYDPQLSAEKTNKRYANDQPLAVLKAIAAQKYFVLLGDQGSGKSTFIYHVTLALAAHALEPQQGLFNTLPGWPDNWKARLPVPIMLREVCAWLQEPPDLIKKLPLPIALYEPIVKFRRWWICRQKINLFHAYLEHWLNKIYCNDAYALIYKQLSDGTAILFLDGLDEVSTASDLFDPIKQMLSDLPNAYPQIPIVVTCRTLNYENFEIDKQLDRRLWSVYKLDKLSEAQIDDFIKDWYRSIYSEAGTINQSTTQSEALSKAVRRPALWQLASNPLFLTVISLLHTYDDPAQQEALPEARALLYKRVVNLLLWRWEVIKQEELVNQKTALQELLQQYGVSEAELEWKLWKLAFAVHDKSGEDSEATANIALGDFVNAFGLNKQFIENLIQVMSLKTGLILDNMGLDANSKTYRFPHRSFQDYLAGCHLSTKQDFVSLAVNLAGKDISWHEVILWAVGQLVHVNKDILKSLDLVSTLCPEIQPDNKDIKNWRKIGLAGQCLVEMGLANIKQHNIGPSVLDQVRKHLAYLINSNTPSLRERIEYGSAFNVLGDERDMNVLLDLGRLHRRAGQLQEAQTCFEQALSWAKAGISTGGYCQIELGELHRERSSYDEAARCFKQAEESFKNDEAGLALVNQSKGTLDSVQRKYQPAIEHYNQALTYYEKISQESTIAIEQKGAQQRIGSLLSNLGIVARNQGDHITADKYFKQSLEVREALGSKWDIAVTLINLGNLRHDQGDTENARDFLEKGLDLLREAGHKWGIANALNNLANVIRTQGQDPAQAFKMYKEALMITRDLEDKDAIASLLEDIAGLAVLQSQTERAFTLWGAATEIRSKIGIKRPEIEKQRVEALLAKARKSKNKSWRDQSMDSGKKMSEKSINEIIDYALQGT